MTAISFSPVGKGELSQTVSPSSGILHENRLSELPLDAKQKQRLAQALPPSFDFFVNGPFSFHAKLNPHLLIRHFQNTLKFWLPNAWFRLSLIGSTVLDLLKDEKTNSNDIDFFGVMGNVQLSEKKLVEHSFLEALRLVLEIDSFDILGSDGTYRTKYIHKPTHSFLIILPKGQNLFQMPGFRLLKGLRCSSEDSLFYVRIPLFQDGKERDLDFTFDLKRDAEPACFSSVDCLYCEDYLPVLDGTSKPLKVVAVKGYDAKNAWGLLKEGGFYYIHEEQASLLRNGLRGYVRIPTKGYRPVKYSSEAIFIKTWMSEYGIQGLSRFFSGLQGYLPLHYPKNFPGTLAYLMNLRTIFFCQKLECQDKFLAEFDQESSALLKNLFSPQKIGKDSDEKEEEIFCDASFLMTLSFWGYVGQKRLDCAENQYPSRFFFPFSSGYILACLPWKMTTELLGKTAEELQRKWIEMKIFIDQLGLTQSATNPRKFLSDSLSKINTDPKVSLYQCLFSSEVTFERFIGCFSLALSSLDVEDFNDIKKNLTLYHPHLKKVGSVLSTLAEEPKEIRFQIFLQSVFSLKIPLSEESAKRLLRQSIFHAKSPYALKLAAHIAAENPQWVELSSLERLGKQILENPLENSAALFEFLFIKHFPSLETLPKLLEIIPSLPSFNLFKEEWHKFWLHQLDQNLPIEFLTTLLQSPYFEPNEKAILSRKILQLAAERRNYETFFFCWDTAESQQCLPIESIPSLIAVSESIAENSGPISWVIDRIHRLQSRGIPLESIRSLFHSFSPPWLELPRNSLRCWAILQKAAGQNSLQVPSLGHETRRTLLRLLLKFEGPESILHEIMEIGRNHLPDQRLSILRNFIAFGKFLKSSALFDKFSPDADFSTLFIPLAQDSEAMKEILNHLLHPDYVSIKMECLPALLPYLVPAHCTPQNLERLLLEGPFPPVPVFQKLLLAAIQLNLPFLKRELPLLLKRLGSANITPQIAEAVSRYLKTESTFELSDLRELLDLSILPPASLWEIAIASRFSPENLLDFSNQCVKKAGRPISEIEDYWRKIIPSVPLPFLVTLLKADILPPVDLWTGAITLKKNPLDLLLFSRDCLEKEKSSIPAIESFWEMMISKSHFAIQWALLQSLYDLPHITSTFQDNIVQAMEGFLERSGQFAHLLDSKKNLPAPLVPKVAEMAILKGKIERALDLLLGRDDVLQMMSLSKLWGFILSVSEEKKKKPSLQEKFEHLLQIGVERLCIKGLPYETLPVVLENFSRLPEDSFKNYRSLFLEFFYRDLEMIKQKPLPEIWKFFRTLLRNGKVEKEMRGMITKMIVGKIAVLEDPQSALRYLAKLFSAHPEQMTSLAVLELFENIIKKMGASIYQETDVGCLWDKLAQQVFSWEIGEDEIISSCIRLGRYFLDFTQNRHFIEPAQFILIALRIENSQKGVGIKFIFDYLELLNSLPPSEFLDEMKARSLFWRQVFIAVSKFPLDVMNIDPFLLLHRHAWLSPEDKALSFICLQGRIVKQINQLAEMGIKPEMLHPLEKAGSYIEEMHEYFMSFYGWLAERKSFRPLNPEIIEVFYNVKPPQGIPINNSRLLYFAMSQHVRMLVSARIAFGQRYVKILQDILTFAKINPFTITESEIFHFFQSCANVSLEAKDLCDLLDQTGSFLEHACRGVSQQAKIFSIGIFVTWLKRNLQKLGLEKQLQAITEHSAGDLEKRGSELDSKGF